MKHNYEANVKKRMMKGVPAELLGGTFKGKAHPHIYKALKDNFPDGTYPVRKCLKGDLTNGEIKYHYAEHLNSSQAMCIAYFKKFFESKEYEPLLVDILIKQGIDVAECGEITDAVFEHIPCSKEGTNFDFYLRFANAKQITWEIKFTEREFGGTTKTGGAQDKYITKYEQIYIPMLRHCLYSHIPAAVCNHYQCLKTGVLTDDCCAFAKCGVYEFYRHYQIRRNILYAEKPGDYVLFLTPKENRALEEGRAYIEQYAARCGTDCIRSVYWEDLLETTLLVVSCKPELLAYYTKFQKKYFG